MADLKYLWRLRGRLEELTDDDELLDALNVEELRYLCDICRLLTQIGACDYLDILDGDDDEDA